MKKQINNASENADSSEVTKDNASMKNAGFSEDAKDKASLGNADSSKDAKENASSKADDSTEAVQDKMDLEYALPFDHDKKNKDKKSKDKKGKDSEIYEAIKPEAYQDFAFPFDKDSERKRDKNVQMGGAFEDLNDYVFAKPIKVSKTASEKHKSKKKKLRGWRKILVWVLIVVAFLFVVGIASVFVLTNMGRSQLLDTNDSVVIDAPKNVQSEENGKYITYKGKNYQFNENVTSILFMGIDEEALVESNEEYGTNGDADVLLLLAFDTESGKTDLISISRDTMAEIDAYSTDGNYIGTKNQQICLAYAYGNGKETSCDNQVSAVRRMFYNVPVNSYIAFDLASIGVLNDAVGGVEVNCLETFGPFTKGEKTVLMGEFAEKYVRLRDTTKLDSNTMRMERQKQYLQGFFNKVVYETKQDLMTPLDLYNTANPYMITNINASKVTYLASNILQKNFSEFNMQTVPGELKQGPVYAEYYVNEDKFYDMFVNVYYTPIY